MSEWLFLVLFFGMGPLGALIMLALHRRAQWRDDVAGWERGQELRRRLRHGEGLG